LTKCYNNTVEIPCPSPGQPFYGQDANYSINPMSYTKLDGSGNTLPDSTTSWVMVRDNVTGLIWEMKTNDGTIHDKDNIYTWHAMGTPANKSFSPLAGDQGHFDRAHSQGLEPDAGYPCRYRLYISPKTILAIRKDSRC
ncbi:MAG: hypothetical protein NTU74_21000, partial [Deltaproteobacteria bacterium]|nr:hypothetical protein [Deltaproteobacteria bacterium]